MTTWRGFASDNYAGIHPEVMAAIHEVNVGHDVAYGDDATPTRLTDLVKDHFGPIAEIFPVFNGTGANVVALQAMTRRWKPSYAPRRHMSTPTRVARPSMGPDSSCGRSRHPMARSLPT